MNDINNKKAVNTHTALNIVIYYHAMPPRTLILDAVRHFDTKLYGLHTEIFSYPNYKAIKEPRRSQMSSGYEKKIEDYLVMLDENNYRGSVALGMYMGPFNQDSSSMNVFGVKIEECQSTSVLSCANYYIFSMSLDVALLDHDKDSNVRNLLKFFCATISDRRAFAAFVDLEPWTSTQGHNGYGNVIFHPISGQQEFYLLTQSHIQFQKLVRIVPRVAWATYFNKDVLESLGQSGIDLQAETLKYSNGIDEIYTRSLGKPYCLNVDNDGIVVVASRHPCMRLQYRSEIFVPDHIANYQAWLHAQLCTRGLLMT